MRGFIPASKSRMLGWGSAEYLAILLGLMAVWRGAQGVLTLAQLHHDRFSWTLTLPF